MSFMRTELEADPAKAEGISLQVFVDGEVVDTIIVDQQPHEGMNIEQTPLMVEAIGDRPILDISFTGGMISITTENR